MKTELALGVEKKIDNPLEEKPEKLPKNRIRAVWAHLRSKKLQARMKPETAKKYKALARKLKQTTKKRGGKPKDYLKEFLWMVSKK